MGRRPVGTGPRREGSGLGLVAYHSDEEEEEEHEQTGRVPTKRAAGSDATADADAAAEGQGSAQQNGKDGEEDNEAAERERARLAAAEAEDLFKSLETEMQSTNTSSDATTPTNPVPTPPPSPAVVVIIPPVDLPALSDAELRKLTAGKPAADAGALRGQLGRLWGAVAARQGDSAAWRVEAVRLAARVQDWRDGLLPSSSLVRRAREAAAAVDAEEEAEAAAVGAAEGSGGDDVGAGARGAPKGSKGKKKAKAPQAAAAAAATAGIDDGGGVALEPISVPEAPPLPPPPPPPADPEPTPQGSEPAKEGGEGAGAEGKATAAAAAVAAEEAGPGTPANPAPGDWTAVWDNTYQSTYYYNTKTGATSWEPPTGLLPSTTTTKPTAAPAPGLAAAAAPTTTTANATGGMTRDLASPIPVTGGGGDALLLFNGERPLVKSAEGVIRLFAGAGPRQVRDLGAGYFCVAFGRPGGAAKAIRLAATDGDKTAAVQWAGSDWVEAARGTYVRFVLPHDEPDRLTLVPVAAREEGVDEEYQVVGATAEAEAAAAAAAAPAVVKGGKVVVGGVVARAPTLRKKRVVAEVEGARGDGGEGEGSKKVKS